MEEEGVAHGAVDGAVEDVGEGFSLFSVSISFAPRHRKGMKEEGRTTRFCDLAIIALAKFCRYPFSYLRSTSRKCASLRLTII